MPEVSRKTLARRKEALQRRKEEDKMRAAHLKAGAWDGDNPDEVV